MFSATVMCWNEAETGLFQAAVQYRRAIAMSN